MRPVVDRSSLARAGVPCRGRRRPLLLLLLALLAACPGGGTGAGTGGGGGGGPPPPAEVVPPSADECRAALENLWRVAHLAGAPDDELVADCQAHANRDDVSCVTRAGDDAALSACGGIRAP